MNCIKHHGVYKVLAPAGCVPCYINFYPVLHPPVAASSALLAMSSSTAASTGSIVFLH